MPWSWISNGARADPKVVVPFPAPEPTRTEEAGVRRKTVDFTGGTTLETAIPTAGFGATNEAKAVLF